jgi:hypothetical protein
MMNAHMTEPRCLIGVFASAILFQDAFATLPKQFRPTGNVVSRPAVLNPENYAG